MTITKKISIKPYDLVTIGMRVAYFEAAGHLDLPYGIEGEEDVTQFAIDISAEYKTLSEYEEINWDDFIEEKIIEKYGRK